MGLLFFQPMSAQPSAPSFVIAGPTASGKSELAVRVAERCGGEIVGADAFQVYAGLGILTAQPSADLRSRVPHHLSGEISPAQAFDVAQYATLARRRIEEIHARGKRAIVCGGTGLYLRALSRGLAEMPAADASLRAELEAQSDADRAHRLAELDPVAHARIDLKNPRRVIRALEVCLLTGRPFSSFLSEPEQPGALAGIVLSRPRAALHSRIASRTTAMFADHVEREVEACSNAGPTASKAIGFQEIRALLAGKNSKQECIEQITLATRQYAKRQATWFRREPAWEPVEVSTTGDVASVVEKIVARILAD